MTTTIYTTASRDEVADFVRSLPAAIAGTGADPHRVGEGFRARLGWSFYSLVAPNFDRLGRGEVGDDGTTWQPNSPEYLAYGKGPASTRRGRGQMPMNRPGGPPAHGGRLGRGPGTGDLSQSQLKRWWHVYGIWKAYFIKSLPIQQAKARAAAKAWSILKQQGAGTKLDRLGRRPDQVLVDRGTLRRSLLPGELVEELGPGASYQTAHGEQIFEEEPGEVLVGSRNEHAAKHHEGQGRLPERRLWPKEVPESWWQEIVETAISGMVRIRELFGGPAS